MYMVTPMVYEKLKKCLDSVDKQTLEKINKPFFVPPSQPIVQTAPIQPPAPSPPPSPPPHFPFNPNVSGEMDWYDMPELEDYPQQFDEPDEPRDEPIGEPKKEEIKREHFFNPEYSEFGTQTDVYRPATSEMSAQTDVPKKPLMSDIQTQTLQQPKPLSFEMETQTDPIRKKIIPLTTSETQTDPLREPFVNPQLKRQGKSIKKKRQKKDTQIVPYVSQERQLVPFVHEQQEPRQISLNFPTPMEMEYHESRRPVMFQPTFDQPMALEYNRPSRLGLPAPQQTMELEYNRPTRLALPAPKQYPIVKKDPRTIQKYKQRPLSSSRRPIVSSHLEHMGEPVRQMLEYESRPRQILFDEHRLQIKNPGTMAQYVVPGPRALEMSSENIPSSSRELSLVQPSYTIEYPLDEPPGERINKRQYDAEIVPPNKIIKYTYSSKKRKLNEPVGQNIASTTQELERFDDPNFGRFDFKKRSKSLERFDDPNFGRYGLKKRNINLAEPKKKFMCDKCGLGLSTRYNLIRHQERELKRFSKGGELTETIEPADFTSWKEDNKKKSKKRTSSEANLKNKPAQKKKDDFDKWN